MYITYSDVTERYLALKTLAGASPMLKDEITYAEYELNGLLGSCFVVPFATVYPTIMDLAIDLTYIRTIRIKDPKKAKEMQDAIYGRIQRIKEGKELLVDSTGAIVERSQNTGNTIWSNCMTYHPTFSMLDEEESRVGVDEDRLDAESSERM